MNDIFYEESARTQNEKSASIKYNIFNTLSIISFIFMVLWLVLIFIAYDFTKGSTYINIIIVLMPFALFLSSGIVLCKIKNKFYVDYDYTFVTGSISIAKVVKNIKRYPVIEFETSKIEKLGKYGSETFNKYVSLPGIKKLILTSNDSPEKEKAFYYLIINTDGEKKLLVLECSETFIYNVLKFSNKFILEEDFK